MAKSECIGTNMSIFTKIKSYLPASSRSLHGMYREVMQIKESTSRLDCVVELVAEYNERLIKIEDAVTSLRDDTSHRLDAFETQSLEVLWRLYQKEGEILEETKRRFFKSLPPAEGEMRKHQLILKDLLREFDSLCRNSQIPYFLVVGTLLGAMRHDGFVPWDDDIDVGVMHDDIERLKDIIREDDRYEITELHDQCAFCRQVRFKEKSDNDGAPFIDLFIYEYSGCETKNDLIRVKEVRNDLITDFKVKHLGNPILYPVDVYVYKNDDASYEAIEDVFDEYREELFEEGLYSTEEEAKSIIWSIENLSYGDPVHIIPIKYFKAMRQAKFEGDLFPILGNSEQLLTQHYKDWLKIPTDIKSHYKHYGMLVD